MSVVVTGCAGFIGAAVCARLLDAGERIIGIDEVNDSYDPSLKEWRLCRLQEKENFVFHRVDIAEKEALFSVLDEAKHEENISAVINLAARAGVRQSIERPEVYLKANITGCLHLLQWSCVNNVDKFIQASSSSVYGSQEEQPLREDAPTDRPLSHYAASKKASELLCHSFHHLYGTDIAVLRFFTVYGPAGRPDMSIFRFIRWITEGEDVIVYGDGEQSRDFTFVQDIADGVIKSMHVKGFEIINLGGDSPVKINRIIAMLESLLGRKCTIRRKESNPLDVRATWADISKARKMLGWEPNTHIEEGLRRTVDWYLENREWASRICLGD